MSDRPVIVWFRQDLRLADNPALTRAAARGQPVIAVYVLDDDTPGGWKMGGAARWWLHRSLTSLAGGLARYGVPLLLRRGKAEAAIPALATEAGASAVHWNRCYEPFAVARDAAIKASLTADGIEASSHNAGLLFEPWEIETGGGGPYKVFTPFWKTCLGKPEPAAPTGTPRALAAGPALGSDALAEWKLQPVAPDRAAGFEDHWTPGADGARDRLDDFLDEALANYAAGRDRPDMALTSRLSPHLHFGEIGPRQVWHGIGRARQAAGGAFPESAAQKFLSEIGWREFCHHLLFHFPAIPEENFRSPFDAFPWRDDPEGLLAWQRGQTGYPVVDAGMRQLRATGWMHNRVRMIVASFLTKDLLVHWREGAAWFWDTLVDADLANNAAGWQWVAGSGADAAPYFRIFNPVSQGAKFDPRGSYVRQWVPEIAGLPDRYIHAPWTAPGDVSMEAGVELGKTYPHPIVDHAAARNRALATYQEIKQG